MGCPFLLQGLSATSSLLTLQGLCLGCFFFQHSFLPTTPSLLSSLYPRLSFRGHLSEHIMKGCFPPHPHTPNCFHHLHCFYKEADVCNYDSGELKMGEGHQEYINHFCHHIFLFSGVITTDSIYQLKASLLFIKLFFRVFPNFQSCSSVSVLAHFPRYSGYHGKTHSSGEACLVHNLPFTRVPSVHGLRASSSILTAMTVMISGILG